MTMKCRLVATTMFATLALTLSAGPWRSSLYPINGYDPSAAFLDTDKVLEDMSYAGYHLGAAKLPNVAGPVINVTSAPYNADATGVVDATAAIQSAINAAGQAGGGVIFLPAGTYRLSVPSNQNQALQINRPNVVLRGAGKGQTFLMNSTYSNMRYKAVIRVRCLNDTRFLASGVEVPLSQDIVHSTKVIPVTSVQGFSVGDTVVVRNDITDDWVNEQGEPLWLGQGATLGGLTYRRTVLAVDAGAGTITIDAPVRFSLKLRDNARVVRLAYAPLAEVGLEDFSIGNIQHPGKAGTNWAEGDASIAGTPGYEVCGSYFIAIERARDCWARRIASYQPAGNTSTAHLLSGGIRVEDSTHVTVEECSFRRPQYGGAGGSGYMFLLMDAGECLIQRSEARFSRHGFQFSGIGSSGNVIHDCIDAQTGRATGDVGGYTTGGKASDHHAGFSQSNLVDVCTAEDSRFDAGYAGNIGSNPKHGLTAVHSIFWNPEGTTVDSAIAATVGPYVVLTEQAHYGYAIGTRGARSQVFLRNVFPAGTAPLDHLEGQGLGDTLVPFSLFQDQRRRRLGPQGGTVFSNNFNAYTPGVIPLSYVANGWSPQSTPQTSDDGATLFSRVVQDSVNLFQRGTNNRYLRLADTSKANGSAAYGANYNYLLSAASNAFTGAGQTGTLSFDFYEPTIAGAQGNGWMLRLGNGWAGNGNTVFALCIGQGQIRRVTETYNQVGATLANYTPNQLHTLTIVFNSSSSTTRYPGRLLPSGTMDVWLDEVRVATGIAASGGLGHAWTGSAPQPITNFNFTRTPAVSDQNLDFTGELYLDDIRLADQALLPPPAGIIPGSPPQPAQALSIRSQGAAGTFGIPLQIWAGDGEPAAQPPIESRAGDDLIIVVDFDKPVASVESAAIVTGVGQIETPPHIMNGAIICSIDGTADAQMMKLRLGNIMSVDGSVLSSATVSLRILQGDVSGNGHVSTDDTAQVDAQAGQPVGSANFRFDLNGDGYVNVADQNLIRSLEGSSIARLPAGDWGVGGDSRSITYNSNTRDSRYPQIWAEQLLQGAITIKKTNVSSLGGITSTTFVSNHLTPLLQKSTVGSIVLIGANDLASSVTEAQTKANIDTIIAAHRTANKALVLLNEYPFQTFTTPQLERHLRIRDYIDAHDDPAAGVWVINSWDAMTTLPRGFVTKAGYLQTDNVHPTPRGAAAMARSFSNETRYAYNAHTPLLDRPDSLYNPNSWSGWSSPSVPGLTVTDVVVDGIAIRKLVFNGVAGTTGTVAQLLGPNQLPAGFTPGVSKVDSVVGYEIKPGSTGFASLSLLTFYVSGTFLVADETGTASDGSDAGSANRQHFPDIQLSGVLHPALGTLPGNANRVQQLIQISGRSASESITGEIWLYQPQLRSY
jgi:lysophospholipase L1-like esterase